MEMMTRSVPTADEAANALEIARLKAAVGYEIIVEQLTLKGFDPTCQTKDQLAIAEHLYKTSGMASKQAAAAAPPTVKFTFNAANPLTGKQESVEIDVTAGTTVLEDPLADIPAFIAGSPPLGTPVELGLVDVDE